MGIPARAVQTRTWANNILRRQEGSHTGVGPACERNSKIQLLVWEPRVKRHFTGRERADSFPLGNFQTIRGGGHLSSLTNSWHQTRKCGNKAYITIDKLGQLDAPHPHSARQYIFCMKNLPAVVPRINTLLAGSTC